MLEGNLCVLIVMSVPLVWHWPYACTGTWHVLFELQVNPLPQSPADMQAQLDQWFKQVRRGADVHQLHCKQQDTSSFDLLQCQVSRVLVVTVVWYKCALYLAVMCCMSYRN